MEQIRQTKRPRRRMGVRLLACAALVAVLACLPLLWFRAQDARMFGTVNQSSGLYESREVSGDDFYLLQQVKNRTQMNRTDWMVSAGLDGTAALYTPAGNSRYNMTSSDTAICSALYNNADEQIGDKVKYIQLRMSAQEGVSS